MYKLQSSLKFNKRFWFSALFIILLVGCTLSSAFIRHLSHREKKKLIKMALAATLLSPPGFGVLPVPLPLPVPFSIESVKPPIIHPFHPGFPMFHGGYGGFGGAGFGGGGGFYG